MRILHLCLACFYIDGYNYQENVFPKINKDDGHEVKIIASTETFLDNKNVLGYCEPKSYLTEFGVPIVRLPYKKIINHFVSSKLRFYEGLFREINNFKPDVIFSHDLSFGSLTDVIKYLKQNRNVSFYADTHSAEYNSGQNFLSKFLLHKLFYKRVIWKALPYLRKYFYIGISEKEYSSKIYGVPEEIMDYLPLGGIVPSDCEYNANREKYRAEFNVADDELLFIHSGKLDALKKTDELIRAFSKVPKLKAKLIIIGSFVDECRTNLEELISRDCRIKYIGWRQSSELLKMLCAADLYCQPGSPSATMQNAVCARCACMVYPLDSYVKIDCGNFQFVKVQEDIENYFEYLENNFYGLSELKQNALICANKYLNYENQVERFYK